LISVRSEVQVLPGPPLDASCAGGLAPTGAAGFALAALRAEWAADLRHAPAFGVQSRRLCRRERARKPGERRASEDALWLDARAFSFTKKGP
jgi:hypothetical protein